MKVVEKEEYYYYVPGADTVLKEHRRRLEQEKKGLWKRISKEEYERLKKKALERARKKRRKKITERDLKKAEEMAKKVTPKEAMVILEKGAMKASEKTRKAWIKSLSRPVEGSVQYVKTPYGYAKFKYEKGKWLYYPPGSKVPTHEVSELGSVVERAGYVKKVKEGKLVALSPGVAYKAGLISKEEYERLKGEETVIYAPPESVKISALIKSGELEKEVNRNPEAFGLPPNARNIKVKREGDKITFSYELAPSVPPSMPSKIQPQVSRPGLTESKIQPSPSISLKESMERQAKIPLQETVYPTTPTTIIQKAENKLNEGAKVLERGKKELKAIEAVESLPTWKRVLLATRMGTTQFDRVIKATFHRVFGEEEKAREITSEMILWEKEKEKMPYLKRVGISTLETATSTPGLVLFTEPITKTLSALPGTVNKAISSVFLAGAGYYLTKPAIEKDWAELATRVTSLSILTISAISSIKGKPKKVQLKPRRVLFRSIASRKGKSTGRLIKATMQTEEGYLIKFNVISRVSKGKRVYLLEIPKQKSGDLVIPRQLKTISERDWVTLRKLLIKRKGQTLEYLITRRGRVSLQPPKGKKWTLEFEIDRVNEILEREILGKVFGYKRIGGVRGKEYWIEMGISKKGYSVAKGISIKPTSVYEYYFLEKPFKVTPTKSIGVRVKGTSSRSLASLIKGMELARKVETAEITALKTSQKSIPIPFVKLESGMKRVAINTANVGRIIPGVEVRVRKERKERIKRGERVILPIRRVPIISRLLRPRPMPPLPKYMEKILQRFKQRMKTPQLEKIITQTRTTTKQVLINVERPPRIPYIQTPPVKIERPPRIAPPFLPHLNAYLKSGEENLNTILRQITHRMAEVEKLL